MLFVDNRKPWHPLQILEWINEISEVVGYKIKANKKAIFYSVFLYTNKPPKGNHEDNLLIKPTEVQS